MQLANKFLYFISLLLYMVTIHSQLLYLVPIHTISHRRSNPWGKRRRATATLVIFDTCPRKKDQDTQTEQLVSTQSSQRSSLWQQIRTTRANGNEFGGEDLSFGLQHCTHGKLQSPACSTPKRKMICYTF